MQRLTTEEIILQGHEVAVRQRWQRAAGLARALFGPSVARLTVTRAATNHEDHQLDLPHIMAFDAAGTWLAYDLTTNWWLPYVTMPTWSSPMALAHQIDATQGLGTSFAAPLCNDLRALAETELGIEILHRWGQESETLTWMYDFTAQPPLSFAPLMADGVELDDQARVTLGQAFEAWGRWEGVQHYVATLYGHAAVKATVREFSSYNDSTYDRELILSVFDAQEQLLLYDLQTPWWQRFGFTPEQIAHYEEQRRDIKQNGEHDVAHDQLFQGRIADEMTRMAMTWLGAEFIATRQPWDSNESFYDLRQPPPLPANLVEGVATAEGERA